MGSGYTFVYFASFVLALVAGTSMAVAMPPQPAKRWIVASTLLAALWALSDFFANLAESPQRMETLAHLLAFSWACLPWTWVRATALYTNSRPLARSALASALLGLPALGCVFLTLTNRLHTSWIPAIGSGHFRVVASPWFFGVGLYFLGYSLLCAWLLVDAGRRTQHRAYRAPARVFLLVIPAASVAGTLLNGGLSALGYEPPMLGSVLVCVISATIASAILRHGFFAPLTQMKRWAEDTVRVSEERYRTLLETSPDGILVLELSGELTVANSTACRMWGESRVEEVRRTRPSLCTLLVPGDRPLARDAARCTIRDGARLGVSMRGLRLDGSSFPLEMSAGVLTGSSGEPVGFVCTVRDVSERVRADAERQALHEQMLHAQKVESLGVLAGGIAHDFNNVLVGVLGYADLALRALPPDAKARPFVETIEQAARSGSLLTKQLLTYAGRGKTTTQAVDLSSMATEMARLLSVSVPKTIEMEFSLEPGLDPVAADPGQIQQVVMNLIANASEAIGQGPGKIRIATRRLDTSNQRTVDHAGTPVAPGTYAVLEVSDTGCGIGPELRGRVFDPFFTTKRCGRGLGLAAVLGILRSHGGAILLESEPGQGTTIRVLLPAVPPPPAPRAESHSQVEGTEPRFSGQAILVADDEPVVRTLIESTLEQAGLRPLSAANGLEAVELCRSAGDSLAAAILDVDMPLMDGPRAAAEVRALRPALPILWVTGRCGADTLQSLRAVRGSSVVTKPFEPQALVARLAVLLREEAPAPQPERGVGQHVPTQTHGELDSLNRTDLLRSSPT